MRLRVCAAAAVLLAVWACAEDESYEDGDFSEGDYMDMAEAEALAMNYGEAGGQGGMQYGAQNGAPVQQGQQGTQQLYQQTAQQGAPQGGQRKNSGPVQLNQLPAGAVRVQKVQLIDRNGFEKPIVASTLLIPAGWSHQGGVMWGQNASCGSGGYNVTFEAVSPDGRSGYNIIPQEQWQWSSMGQTGQETCPTLQIGTTRQYIEYLLSRARPNARILDYRQRPDIEQPLKQFNRNDSMPGNQIRYWVEAGEALVAYNENGVDMRETIVSAVMFTHMRMESPGMAPMEFISGVTLPSFAMRAPNGQLDFKFAEMLRTSGRPNPEWSARISQHNAKIARTNLKGAQDRSRIIAQTGNEILDMQQDSWRKQNESFNRMSRESSEAIRGVETYNDPYYGGTVELDNTYEHTWQLDDGTYVLSNDALMDPNVDLGVNATRLEVTE